jgi:hypothetical protein
MIVNLAELLRRRTSPPPPWFDIRNPGRRNPLSLEQQKKRAKDLLHAVRSKHPDAITRFQRHSPECFTSKEGPRLNDAQQVIAREIGFRKWTDLKAHIDRIQVERRITLEGSPSALDGSARTLHIRCGQDIQHDLSLAGFNGDFLSFPDPYIEGPVPRTQSLEEFIRIRAEYLNPGDPDTLEQIRGDYQDLERAREYSVVCIWMEHDSFDQLILARLLHFFSEASARPKRLRMINVTHFPGIDRFHGLGQLPPQALRLLWDDFEDVTAAQLKTGTRAWHAITSPTPDALLEIIKAGTPSVPTLGTALARHLRELPSLRNGLSMVEELTLRILSDKGSLTPARLWGWYNGHYEPMPFMGDSEYWRVIERLSQSDDPALRTNKRGETVGILPFGERLLRNEADWLATNPAERWVGGVLITPRKKRNWRFDEQRGVTPEA